jgi:hypothetical protein
MPRNNGRITMETQLPEKINVIRSITYDVPSIVDSLKELMGEEDINIDSVMEYIEDWVSEDMSAPLSRHDLTYLDENGQEL